jgi:hypothetical protein
MARVRNVSNQLIVVSSPKGRIELKPGDEADLPEEIVKQLLGQVVFVEKPTGVKKTKDDNSTA